MPNRIKALRLSRGLTLQQVAAAAGTSFQQIRRLELGERRLSEDWMRRIAPILGVSPQSLLIDAPVQDREVIQDAEEVRVLRWWRAMNRAQKEMIATFALGQGFEILAHKPKRRRRA